jgi:hypothetical protein
MTIGTYWEVMKKFQRTLPVDVIGLAKEMGLKLSKTAEWSNGLSGMIRLEEGGVYRIIVNAKHSQHRQRFTIAHELAHFMLHKPLIGDELADDALYRSGLSNGVEMEANAMAADILMPRAEVLRFKRDRDMTSTSMAEKFDVSQSAMDIRLGVPSEQ